MIHVFPVVPGVLIAIKSIRNKTDDNNSTSLVIEIGDVPTNILCSYTPMVSGNNVYNMFTFNYICHLQVEYVVVDRYVDLASENLALRDYTNVCTITILCYTYNKYLKMF